MGYIMNNSLYKKILLDSSHTDGETPIVLELTEEINGLIFWEYGPDSRNILFYEPPWNKDKAIERAVHLAKERCDAEQTNHEIQKYWVNKYEKTL